MKKINRIIAFSLAVVNLFSLLGGCNNKKEEPQMQESQMPTVNISFSEEYAPKPINASFENKNIFMYNPDRGFRVHNVIRVHELIDYVDDEVKLEQRIKQIFDSYTARVTEPWSLTYCYIYLTKWNHEELPEEALVAVEGIFKYARKNKIKLLASFCYNNTIHETWVYVPELKEELPKVCADQDTILKHIDQLAPIVSEYKDSIFTIKGGFIGFVGEWVYVYQYPEVDYDVISRAIVDKLCIPNDLYFSHRLPRYTVSVKERYPDWDGWKKIGFNNCAFFGEQTRENWESEGFQVGDEAGWWEYICENGAYFPVSGETFTSTGLNRTNRIPIGKEAILELAHHWHTVLSFFHGRYDASPGEIKVMENWENEELGTEWLDANGIIYDPNWFLDDNGNAVIRNCYEFIRDHLGYKIVAENIKLNAADGKLKVDMAFKNYGFSAAFNLESGFAILNEDYEPISEVKVGDPTKWYSHDPENWRSTEVLDHSLSAELNTPTESGKYYVAFFLRNTQGTGAQLSNDVVFENNYNILYAFEM